jgi:exopolysaccharide biosynthesis protein
LLFFKIDLRNNNIALKPLTPNGVTTYAMQSIPDMVKTNVFPGYKIIGAVNSDFYNMSTGEPRSVLIVDGKPIREILPAIRSYFGITNEGKPIIGDASVYLQQKESILNAVGGYHRLIKNTIPVNQTDVSIHPRTAVGFTSNQTVYFLVADGRNASYSNGLTLTQVAEIMKALEVKEAINLDGGGSSTFVVNTNQLLVRNKPSDGTPRKVANGWAICIKK